MLAGGRQASHFGHLGEEPGTHPLEGVFGSIIQNHCVLGRENMAGLGCGEAGGLGVQRLGYGLHAGD